jgi:hypothetical protein
MTTQLPPRERSGSEAPGGSEQTHPEVLFEEARRRRRRRWVAGAALSAVIIAGVLTLDLSGGGGGGAGGQAQRQPSGSGSGAASAHGSASRGFASAPATERYYTGPGASCPLAPRNRYLPPWSGCVSTMVADVYGDGRRDLVLVYSRLGHKTLGGLPPRTLGRRQLTERFPALQAMLRVVTPGGRSTTVPITYRSSPSRPAPGQVGRLPPGQRELERAAAAALISIAHVSNEPGRTIFVQTGQISSGSTALAYSPHAGSLVWSGALLGYGGDAGSQAGFQCVAGKPPRLIQNRYDLVRGIKTIGDAIHIYGIWKVTATRYDWHGPRLVRLTQTTTTRRLTPHDTVGHGCVKGIS